MSIKQKDLKLLWGKAASLCSICKIPLSASRSDGENIAIGEQAHIVGEQEEAPRGKSHLSLEDRNSYNNLILLCPTHHTEIDKNELDYTVEKLHAIKSAHEAWVGSRCLQGELENPVYGYLITAAVQLCHLDIWEDWISSISSTSLSIHRKIENDITEFINIVFRTHLPNKYIRLENSITTLHVILQELFSIYHLHIRLNGDYFTADRFYNLGFFNPHYDADLEKYNKWEKQVTLLSFEATKAVNWFAEEVRNSVDPSFYAMNKFVIRQGPFANLGYEAYYLEFSDEEKSVLPQSYHYTDIDTFR